MGYILTIEAARMLKGRNIVITSQEWAGNTPHVDTFKVGEIKTRQNGRTYLYDYEGKSSWCTLSGNTFVGSDDDRPVYYKVN